MQTLSATRDDPRSDAALIAAGRRALEIEARALAALPARVDARFARACALCLAATDAPATGRVVVSGLGKSGHVAHKIAATLASTGTSAFFLHAAEASHGDLGMVVRGDVLLAVSHSGDSGELLALLPHLTRLSVPVIALTGSAASPLARAATVHLDVSVAAEACPLNLAPTASTTASLAMGDALAAALLAARGFTPEDFARSHPGGALGRRLLLRVADVMRQGEELPRVAATVTLEAGLVEMGRKGLGLTAVTDDDGRLLGVFTDGDLRRAMQQYPQDLLGRPVSEIMTDNPVTIPETTLLADAHRRMQHMKLKAFVVVDDKGKVSGVVEVFEE